ALLSGIPCSLGGSNGRLAALNKQSKTFDLARRDVSRVAPLQLLFRFQLVNRLLEGAFGLNDLRFALRDVQLRDRHVGVDLCNLAHGGLDRRLLLRAVEPEDRRTLLDVAGISDQDLGHASVRLWKNRHGPEEQGDVARRGMIVEYRRDEKNGED